MAHCQSGARDATLVVSSISWSSVGVIGLIVLFQEDIRHFLYSLGAHRKVKNIIKLFTRASKEEVDKETIMPIVMACMSMSRGKVGALIVIERGVMLEDIVETGRLDRRPH